MFWIWLMCVFISAAILSGYNRAGTGFLLGLILGPFGVIFAIVMRSDLAKKEDKNRHTEQMELIAAVSAGRHENTKAEDVRHERDCPWCAEKILFNARVCKHCGRDVEPGEPDAQAFD